MNIKLKSGKVFERKAWTGGGRPTEEIKKDQDFKELRSFFFKESLKESGGLDLWKFSNPVWEYEKFQKVGYYGTGSIERARIFWRRANYDAFSTITDR